MTQLYKWTVGIGFPNHLGEKAKRMLEFLRAHKVALGVSELQLSSGRYGWRVAHATYMMRILLSELGFAMRSDNFRTRYRGLITHELDSSEDISKVLTDFHLVPCLSEF